MVASNLHDDLDSLPQIPAFTGTASTRQRRESFSDALSGAAVAFAKVFSGEQPNTCKSSNGQKHSSSNSTSLGVSPGKACELRMKNSEQLRYLQQLFDDGILTQQEFVEQKKILLEPLVNCLSVIDVSHAVSSYKLVVGVSSYKLLVGALIQPEQLLQPVQLLQPEQLLQPVQLLQPEQLMQLLQPVQLMQLLQLLQTEQIVELMQLLQPA